MAELVRDVPHYVNQTSYRMRGGCYIACGDSLAWLSVTRACRTSGLVDVPGEAKKGMVCGG